MFDARNLSVIIFWGMDSLAGIKGDEMKWLKVNIQNMFLRG
jgi:hypothetical protein